MIRDIFHCSVSVLILLSPVSAMSADSPGIHWTGANNTATISGEFHGSSIVIGASSRTAGAIDSLTWRGKQFVESSDHGREFQSASFFRGAGLCLNPTEAGSNGDSFGPTSTSQLLTLSAQANKLSTKSYMAFWDAPSDHLDKCAGTTGSSPLSKDMLIKTVTIGAPNIPNVIEDVVTFRIPDSRTQAGFEALTGYMPPEFANFWTYDPSLKQLIALEGVSSNKPLKVFLPLILSTEDRRYAIGIYSPQNRKDHSLSPIYTAYKFLDRRFKTVKWGCYFEEHLAVAGDQTFTCLITIGTLDDVTNSLNLLWRDSR